MRSAHPAAAAGPPAFAGAWRRQARRLASALRRRPQPAAGQQRQAALRSAAPRRALLRRRSRPQAGWAALPWLRRAATQGSTRTQRSGCRGLRLGRSSGRLQLRCARLFPKDRGSAQPRMVEREQGGKGHMSCCALLAFQERREFSQLHWRQQAGPLAQSVQAHAPNGIYTRNKLILMTRVRAHTGSSAAAGQRISAAAQRTTHCRQTCSHTPVCSTIDCLPAVGAVLVSAWPPAVQFTVPHAGTSVGSLRASEDTGRSLSCRQKPPDSFRHNMPVYSCLLAAAKSACSALLAAAPLTVGEGHGGRLKETKAPQQSSPAPAGVDFNQPFW